MSDGGAYGRYQLLRKLAVGGMAEVFLAKASGIAGFEKLVVIKRILPELSVEPEFVEMFLDEARLAATMSHPNVVQIFDLGQLNGTCGGRGSSWCLPALTHRRSQRCRRSSTAPTGKVG